ncbi:Glucuronosyltransferase [Aphelenchoides fujianensis]|nr:Glucuronosyltransferase [Aphelenchoides fujianensis]
MEKANGSRKANVIRYESTKMWEIAQALQPMKVDLFEEDMDIANPRNIAAFSEAFRLHCEGILEDKQFLEFLKSREYTVGMAEYYDGCAFGLFEMLNVRSTHQLSAIPMCEQTAFIHGLPAPPSFVPALISNQAQITPISGFFERARNLYFHLRYSYLIAPRLVAPTDEVFKEKISAKFPSLIQLMQKVDYVWVNTNEQLDIARPTTSKFKFVGGIALKPPTSLDEELQRLIDESPKGVVLMSFGSLLDDLATKPAVLRTILDSFAQFPDHLFLCKLTIGDDAKAKDLLEQHPNVRIYSWLNQQGILAHPKTRAFISHVGLNGLNEAAFAGVPLVAIPFSADGPYNSAAAVRRGIAVALDRKTLTVHGLTNAIRRVLEDETIRHNSKDLHEKLVSQPFKPADVFVRTVEYAAQFNGMPELTLQSTSLSTFEYFCLDVFLSIIAASIFMVALFGCLIRRCLYGKQKRKIE